MRIHPFVLLCSALLFFAGCPAGDDDDASDDDVGDDDTTGDDDAGDDDSASSDDISTSCADAPALPMDGEWTESELEIPEDEDFFTITVAEDAFLSIWTGFYDENVEGQLDPVVSLYDEAGTTLLATADDQIPRTNTDSELRYHAVPGTYCVKLEGWEHWAGATASIETTDWSYALNALVMDPDLPDLWYEGVLNPDTEPNDDPANAQAGTLYEGSGGHYGTVFGMLETASDVDVYSFTTAAAGETISIYHYLPTGPGGAGVQGHGTTLELGRVEISDTMGNIIGSVDGTLGMEAISLPFEGEQEILLWVRAPDGWTSGANDFYVIDLYHGFTGNPQEVEPNNLAPEANTTSFSSGSAYLAGELPTSADIDYWSFSATANQTFAVACGALRNGSGVMNATFTVEDESGTVLQTETETETADILWSDTASSASMDALQITDAGTYYLRITCDGTNPAVMSTSYMCGIHDVTP